MKLTFKKTKISASQISKSLSKIYPWLILSVFVLFTFYNLYLAATEINKAISAPPDFSQIPSTFKPLRVNEKSYNLFKERLNKKKKIFLSEEFINTLSNPFTVNP